VKIYLSVCLSVSLFVYLSTIQLLLQLLLLLLSNDSRTRKLLAVTSCHLLPSQSFVWLAARVTCCGWTHA